MKKITLLALAITLSTLFANAQTTAIDFTLTDCNSTSRSLFPILDSGNVVVLVYEHQCGSCLNGATNLKNAINTSFASNPLIKVLYLDNGGYSCSSVQTWVSSHSLIPGTCFAYSNTQSSPYGSGMPVIVITAGKSHKVYAITNSVNLPTVSTLTTAIQNALNDLSSGINYHTVSVYDLFKINSIDNNSLKINFNNAANNLYSFSIINTSGQVIVPSTKINSGNSETDVLLSDYKKSVFFLIIHYDQGQLVKKIILGK